MRRSSPFVTACLVALISALPAQNPTATAPAPTPRTVPAPPTLLQPFQVASGTLQELAVPTAPTAEFAVDIVLAGQRATLVLAPHDLRRAGYRLLVDDGTAIREVPSGPAITFRGHLDGHQDSLAACVVQNGQLKGIVRDGASLWGIQPASESDPRAAAALHVIYRSTDNWNLPYVCGVPNGPAIPVSQAGGTDVTWDADLALEVDFPQYQRFNNVTNAQNDALSVVNGMDVIYRRDCQISFTVGTVLVRTAADPYSSTDAGTLLTQFQGWWNSNPPGATRDVTMLFTGRAINGNVIGLAYVAQVCNVGAAYGLTETMYAGVGTNITNRVGLLSHEMGHLWSAQHCDATADCRIMCSGLGGCGGNVSSFSASELGQITSYRNSVNCLTQQTSLPTVSAVSPNIAQAFQPPVLTLSGTGFTGVNQITIGAQVITTGITVVSDSQIRLSPPDAIATGISFLRVANSAGQSNPILFTYTDTVPIRLVSPTAALGGAQITFRFGGRNSHLYYMGLSFSPATGLLQGYSVLSSFSGTVFGTLPANGIGSWPVTVPPGILNGITLYEQVLEFDATTLQVTSSSNVTNTRFFL